MATRKKYPIGEQNFANIRKDDLVYIDKTHLIYNILSEIFFRPRRLCKSLLLSTMRYYFEGHHDLLKGLAIFSLEKEWRKRPVIYLDLSRGRTIDRGSLHSMINNKLFDAALKQIEDKQYAKPFEADRRTKYKIGVNFSTQLNRIDDWKIG